MWIDTHCHLDATEFDADRARVVERARAVDVGLLVIPAVDVAGLGRVRDCAHQFGAAYALGIHPLYVERAAPQDLDRLAEAAQAAMHDTRFVAIGEIGIDFHVEGLDRALQERYYGEQLRLAQRLGLPVLLHVRRSADALLRQLRKIEVPGGIAHAFNGSEQQAQDFIAAGFRLGFGGSSTYDGSLRIRRHAVQVPEHALVLETDAPDIPPQWLREPGAFLRNEPMQLPRIAAGIAALRGISVEHLALVNCRNAAAALPRLARWIDPQELPVQS